MTAKSTRSRLRGAFSWAAVAVAALVVPLSPGTDAQAAPAAATDVSAAAATFTDDFNGPAGAPVDGSKWRFETGDNVNNHERQWYTSGTNNAALDGNGNLVITAKRENPGNHQCWYGRCEYTSARLSTAQTFTQTYGHYEARIKMSRGQGMWPAFWMLGSDIGSVGWPNSGEIDIMENVGFEPNTVHGTIHGPGYSGAGGIGAGYSGPAFADGFHTFAVDWTPGRIVWSVDGNAYSTKTTADVGGNRWVFDHPFYLILNLAVGGYWPGDPNGSTPFPNQLVVDYVHVTSGDGGTAPRTGRVTGIGGKCLDVAGAATADGTPVQIANCSSNPAQSWTFGTDGTIRAFGKCLDVTSGSTANGARVQLWTCNSTGAQKWAVSPARDVVNIAADKCLDVVDGSSNDGARTQIWACTGAAQQKWTTP